MSSKNVLPISSPHSPRPNFTSSTSTNPQANGTVSLPPQGPPRTHTTETRIPGTGPLNCKQSGAIKKASTTVRDYSQQNRRLKSGEPVQQSNADIVREALKSPVNAHKLPPASDIQLLQSDNFPLHLALQHNLSKSVQWLLDNPAIKPNEINSHGETALRATIRCGNLQYIEMLVQHGAYVDPENKKKNSLVSELLFSQPITDSVAFTTAVSFLLDDGADLEFVLTWYLDSGFDALAKKETQRLQLQNKLAQKLVQSMDPNTLFARLFEIQPEKRSAEDFCRSIQQMETRVKVFYALLEKTPCALSDTRCIDACLADLETMLKKFGLYPASTDQRQGGFGFEFNAGPEHFTMMENYLHERLNVILKCVEMKESAAFSVLNTLTGMMNQLASAHAKVQRKDARSADIALQYLRLARALGILIDHSTHLSDKTNLSALKKKLEMMKKPSFDPQKSISEISPLMAKITSSPF
ncbi:ankyrin repeat domain-containing protein [Paraburkholderia hayleyella]|uniref:ankyrin repeat domain-containing protein n=1 Tax=Paraburkholderia hayleyella TaxID=2152889 RepID=UPI0012924091|nr:ankyrin repeat domain-containing protein [Paraburkholderia hayleyella]